MKKLCKSLTIASVGLMLLAGCNNNGNTNNNNSNNNNNSEDNTNKTETVENNAANPIQFSGSIDENTTWPDLGLPVDYIIDGSLDVNGNALLTIDPGVTIMFTDVNCRIYVGENAGLKMAGTADKPIIIEGPENNPNNGSWHNVRIESKRNDNQFEYVQFLRGGSNEGELEGVVHLAGGRLSMKHCLIDGSLGMGLVIESDESYLTAFEDNTIKNCAAYPWISEYFTAICKNIGTGNAFENNGKNMVCCKNAASELKEDMTIHELPIPYYLQDGSHFEGNKTLTIEPGVEFVIPIYLGIGVSEECGFVANGTKEKPIIFRCEEEGEAWNGIIFESTRNNNIFNYCQIRNGGSIEGWKVRCCLYIQSDAKLTLTNNIFGPTEYNGVGISEIENWKNVTHSGNTFVNCESGNVWVETGGTYNGKEYEDNQYMEDLP